METISIIIPTHDRQESLRRLIEALAAQTTLPTEVIVVSDGAQPVDEGCLAPLRAAGVSTRLIPLESASSAASRNAGLAVAGGDVVLCLDDDIIPAPDLLTKLLELYAADPGRRVSGIGIPYAEVNPPAGGRWWDLAFCLLGRVRWRPRRQAARYVQLPAALARRLAPAEMISGGSISLRRETANVARFDETFRGYAFGEDRELSYRLGREYALFRTRELRVQHASVEGGRGDWRTRGCVYVRNVLHVVRTSVDGGVGTGLLVAVDLAGAFVQHLVWAAITRKRHNFDFALGLAGELLRQAGLAIKEMLCGR